MNIIFKLWLAALILLTVVSCKEDVKKTKNLGCSFQVDQILKSNPTLKVESKYNNGKISLLIDDSNDSSTYGLYDFYPSGLLRSYRFFTSKEIFVYNEEFDSLGNITLIEGSPIVLRGYRTLNESVIRFTYFFSSLGKNYNNVTISTKSGFSFQTRLFDNEVFSNIKSVTFNLPISEVKKESLLYVECELENQCIQKKWNVKDTFDISKINLQF